MAKNQVAPDRPTNMKDTLFNGSRSKFKHKVKTVQNKQKLNMRNFQNDKQNRTEEKYLKPSLSGSNNFFKTSCKTVSEVSEKPKTKNSVVGKLESNKKPFDKKMYRLHKYSKKYKLQQWEDKRKKAVLRGYYRDLKDDEPKLDVQHIYEKHRSEIDSEGEDMDGKINEENENNLSPSINQNIQNTDICEDKVIVPKNSKGKKIKAFKKAHLEFHRIKEEKQKQVDKLSKKKAEKEEALQEYKRKKVEKFKKLSRKTKRGQPIMKDRIEMLLEKIQNSM
ncbi:hypothetical protein NQ314_014006 [Rhamnusium bicolor]|uniref:Thyroid transcription factor 1-associated protein 26 n=1 Tax=Rhamnusium bicolor TaxID=1586634 RepID=A0AAV8X454_9CUCU|nr:hypothetical protein NQ314_014006 [Rhamnusium bicolor]